MFITREKNGTLSAIAVATLSAPISFCQKTKKNKKQNQISPFATTFKVRQRVLLETDIVPILLQFPSLRLDGV